MKYPVGSIIEYIGAGRCSRREVLENDNGLPRLLVLDDRSIATVGSIMIVDEFFLDNPENYRFSAEYRIDKLLEKYKN